MSTRRKHALSVSLLHFHTLSCAHVFVVIDVEKIKPTNTINTDCDCVRMIEFISFDLSFICETIGTDLMLLLVVFICYFTC